MLPSMNLLDKLNLLGSTLRQAHQSITSVLTTESKLAILNPTTIRASAQGRLDLTIVEARNLKNSTAQRTGLYCIIRYDSSTTKLKWHVPQSLDVSTDQGEMIVQVYDSGRQLSTGEDLLLGTSTWTPTFEESTVDLWLPLNSSKEQVILAGELRVQVRYTPLGTTTRLTPKSFRIIQQIGHGSFGKVYKVEKRDTQKIYAMKVLSKRLLVEQNEVKHTISERNVLLRTTTSPFVVNLQFSFQTADRLFLVMDYLPGGDLYTYLQRHRMLEEDHARFFVAELVCALSDLHTQKVLYRDLKPENILLDDQGHIALTDFGLCKELEDTDLTTSTFCGTTEYMPPEMILKENYTQAIDMWCLGILLYELITGGAPFHSVHLDTLYQRILKQPLTFPSSVPISNEAKDLIHKLLHRDPAKRLRTLDIKRHPFFDGICWEEVAKKQVPPPTAKSSISSSAIAILPSPNNSASLSRCDSSSLESQVSFMVRGAIPLSVSTQNAFQGFSYIPEDGPLHSGD